MVLFSSVLSSRLHQHRINRSSHLVFGDVSSKSLHWSISAGLMAVNFTFSPITLSVSSLNAELLFIKSFFNSMIMSTTLARLIFCTSAPNSLLRVCSHSHAYTTTALPFVFFLMGFSFLAELGLGDFGLETWTWILGLGHLDLDTWTWKLRLGLGDLELETCNWRLGL